jgi:hypothetical protein
MINTVKAMKHRTLINIAALVPLAGILLQGCQQPEPRDLLPARSARKVLATVSVCPEQDPHATKSTYTGSEDTVWNWNLLMFEQGVLKAAYYQASGNDMPVTVMTDRPYKYYALANVGDLRTRFTPGTTTESDMASLRVSANVGDGLPMAWNSLTEIAFSRQQLADGARLPVQLTRLTGRYDIAVDQSGLSLWSFTASSLTLYGAGSVTPFATGSKADAAAVQVDAATSADLKSLNKGGATHYYPLENCQGDLLAAGTDPWNKIPGNIDPTAHPSYIELKGKVKMTDGSNLKRSVTYRFYLGKNASNNFDVERNTVHTVTLVLTDASVSGAASTHWKVKTGSFTDTRSLSFTHDTIRVLAGTTMEEVVIRTPEGLRYLVEMDANLSAAGVTVAGVTPGEACNLDRLSIAVPADVTYQQGAIRLKTLDGVRTAEATLEAGRQLTALRIGLWPDATHERFHADTTLSLYPTGSFRAHVYAFYTDGAVEDVTPGRTFTFDPGAFTCQHTESLAMGDENLGCFTPKRKPGTFTISTSYTDNGITCTATSTVTLNKGPLSSIQLDPEGEQTLYSGGKEYPFTVKAVYEGTDGTYAVDPDRASWTFSTGNLVEYAGGGKLRTLYSRGRTEMTVRYTEGARTVESSEWLNVTSNLVGLVISPDVIYLRDNGDSEVLAYEGYTNNATANDHVFTLRAYYDDGTDEDVTLFDEFLSEKDDNHPVYYQGDDGYWHVANAYWPYHGTFILYRAKSQSNGTRIRVSHHSTGDTYRIPIKASTLLDEDHPSSLLFSMSFTYNGVTKTAIVMGTIERDPAVVGNE